MFISLLLSNMLEDIDVILFCFGFIEKWLQDSQLNVSTYPQIFPLMRRKAKCMMSIVRVVKSFIAQTGCPSVHVCLFVVIVINNISLPF